MPKNCSNRAFHADHRGSRNDVMADVQFFDRMNLSDWAYIAVGQAVTGRDLQPSWAHVPGARAALTSNGRGPSGASSGNGRADQAEADDQKTPAPGDGRGPGTTRRPRPGNQGKGRKRGKR